MDRTFGVVKEAPSLPGKSAAGYIRGRASPVPDWHAMDIRYVRNTAGDYVAFVAGESVFTPGGAWLGALRQSRVYNPEGFLVGALLPDDRIVRDRTLPQSKAVSRPKAPMHPVRPLPPKRGLFLPECTHPVEDVFQGLRRPLTALVPLPEVVRVAEFHGCVVRAADGTFLGRISRDPRAAGSIANAAEPWGDPRDDASLFNATGPYGGPLGPLSAYDPDAATPPLVERDGDSPVPLSVNVALPDRLDPNALVSWLAAR